MPTPKPNYHLSIHQNSVSQPEKEMMLQLPSLATGYSSRHHVVRLKPNASARGEAGIGNETSPRFAENIKQVKQAAVIPSLIVAIVVAVSPICNPPVSHGQTIEVVNKGATLFRQSCIGCHDAGGNVIQPGATLFTKDLQRNGVNTEEEIYRVTYFGKGRMPGFGEQCTPKGQCTFGPRLPEEDIKLLAEFVKLQADKGWLD